jgi:antitoxin VapB
MMAISIRNPLAEKLARKVAEETGESLTQAIIHSLEERLERLQGRKQVPGIEEEIIRISGRCSALPDLDERSPEEILGYDDERGLPSHDH